MSDSWGRVKDVFEGALDQPQDARADWLGEACDGDDALRQEVEDLLRAHRLASARSFLETTAVEAALAAEEAAVDAGPTDGGPARATPGGPAFGGSRYVLLEPLGEGGIGVVWKARDDRLGRLVALKFLHPHYANDKDALQRFAREARSASALNHSGVCTVYGIGEQDGRPFIAMELLEGRTLWDRLQEGPLRGAELLDTAIAIAGALSAIHEVGIAHRDLKPGNVYLTGDGRVKVLDFGLAKVASATETLDAFQTRTGATLGTVAYMSPEQARGEPVDLRSDLFSFGTVLYEMATGRPAFHRATHGLTFDAVLNREPTAASEIVPDLPVGLEAVMRRALQKDPAQRYASALEMRRDLEKVRSGQGSVVKAPAAPAPPAPSWQAFVPVRFLISAMLVVAVAAGAEWWRGRSATPAYDSVAVLPFAVAGGDPGDEYLAEGVTEGVINGLARLPGIRVVPRAAVYRVKGREDLAAVGRELGVRAVVTGRIAQQGPLFAVGVELVELEKMAQLWGHRYTRPMGDLVAVQEDIVDAIAARLRPSGTASSTRDPRVTRDPEAYRLYLRGRYEWERRTDESLRRAVSFFEQALALDPRYALAHAGIADAWLDVSDEPPLATQPRAKAAALTALAIDPGLAEAHTSLAMHQFVFDWEFEAAERSFRRAIELNPQHATAHHWYGLLLMTRGRFDEARRSVDRARQADPVSPIIEMNRARVEYYAGDAAAAAGRLRALAEREPRVFFAHALLSVVEARRGQWDLAMAAARRAEERDDAPDRATWTAYVAAAAGRGEEARSRLAAVQEEARGRYLQPYRLALVHAALGEKEAAFAHLDRALQERSPWLAYLERDPAAAPLRDDPRFAVLLARITTAGPEPAPAVANSAPAR